MENKDAQELYKLTEGAYSFDSYKNWLAVCKWILRTGIPMEDKVGRSLSSIERVHHIDLDKTNNDPENLLLCKNPSEHLFLHRELEYIAGQLVRSGVIRFENGHYRISDE